MITDRPISLNWEETTEFINNLLHPSTEDVEKRRKLEEEWDRTFTIHQTEDGFMTEIKNPHLFDKLR